VKQLRSFVDAGDVGGADPRFGGDAHRHSL
jgi:hypothetical protein